ncbi:PRC-barrel domain-containing protein [Defluviimonas sp. SAOS-178_SWC]|uniref:PRC-barrel domain-containing protein n=1 Tax=Defluviimonas sp. SAOS-178_SWC TaxID=3121287 RepID=UPI003221A577
MKNLMISTAFLALAGTASVAQDVMFREAADPMEVHASEFIGQRVYSSETALDSDAFDGLQDGWDDIGEVNDVILSRDGSVEAVLVDIGGFLGMGERQVAVDMSALRFVGDSATADDEADYFLVMNASRANFEEAPEYSWAYGAMEKADTVGDAAATTATAVGDVANDAAEAVTRDPVMRDGYETAVEADLTTEMLTGAKAYDANDEWIGEISELILNDQGKITHGIIDVGGFLGLGEKPVELAMADIDILHETGGDDVRVYVSMTRDQLEALPTYEK